MTRYAGIDDVVFVPCDSVSLDEAIAGGHTLGEIAPDSPVRRALLPLARRYAGVRLVRPGRRRRARGDGRRSA